MAGAVGRAGVVCGELTVGEAVERAGGATEAGWVALDGGAMGGKVVGEDEVVRTPLLLVLAARHPLVARARTSLSDWLKRAASACEGCRACSEVCPVGLEGGRLEPHEVIWTLVSGRDDGTRLAAAGCMGSGCAIRRVRRRCRRERW